VSYGVDPITRRFKQGRATRCRGSVKLLIEAAHQMCEVSPAERQCFERRRVDASHCRVVQRPRQRARESGCIGNRSEVGQSPVLQRIERRACGNRFRSDQRCRSDPSRREDRRRQPGGELGEAESMKARGGATGSRDVTSEIVGRSARGRYEQRAPSGARLQPKPRFPQPAGGLRRFDDDK
jgi:hypothetical protein